jgi:hypothetical protein
MGLIKTLLSLRLNPRRMHQVLYQAPGFLHGTYMLQQHGDITHAHLVAHAVQMRYGPGMVLLGDAMHAVSMSIKVVEIR